jgi:hypothetical protein
MSARESKQALAEAAALLGTDTREARAFLRAVQRLAGPLPYGTIVAAMRTTDHADAGAVAASLHADAAATSARGEGPDDRADEQARP